MSPCSSDCIINRFFKAVAGDFSIQLLVLSAYYCHELTYQLLGSTPVSTPVESFPILLGSGFSHSLRKVRSSPIARRLKTCELLYPVLILVLPRDRDVFSHPEQLLLREIVEVVDNFSRRSTNRLRRSQRLAEVQEDLKRKNNEGLCVFTRGLALYPIHPNFRWARTISSMDRYVHCRALLGGFIAAAVPPSHCIHLDIFRSYNGCLRGLTQDCLLAFLCKTGFPDSACVLGVLRISSVRVMICEPH